MARYLLWVHKRKQPTNGNAAATDTAERRQTNNTTTNNRQTQRPNNNTQTPHRFSFLKRQGNPSPQRQAATPPRRKLSNVPEHDATIPPQRKTSQQRRRTGLQEVDSVSRISRHLSPGVPQQPNLVGSLDNEAPTTEWINHQLLLPATTANLSEVVSVLTSDDSDDTVFPVREVDLENIRPLLRRTMSEVTMPWELEPEIAEFNPLNRQEPDIDSTSQVNSRFSADDYIDDEQLELFLIEMACSSHSEEQIPELAPPAAASPTTGNPSTSRPTMAKQSSERRLWELIQQMDPSAPPAADKPPATDESLNQLLMEQYRLLQECESHDTAGPVSIRRLANSSLDAMRPQGTALRRNL